MVRNVGIAGGVFLLLFAVASLATGQHAAVVGDIAQLVPVLAYAGLSFWLARQCRGQVRLFWNLNSVHAIVWATGQFVWTYYDM